MGTANNKPTLYLHIGHAKAGSTTLQAFLFKNWQHLDAAGFALPTAKLTLANQSAPPGNPLQALQAIKASGDVSILKRWIETAAQSHNKLILSSECLFEWKWHKLFMPLVDLVNIQLVYYVRRQDEIMLSAWRQWGLKNGLSLAEFIENRLKTEQPDYWSNIAPWRGKVGLAGHHIRFINQAFLVGSNILDDFCAFTGLDSAKMVPVANQNISHDARLLTFMSNRPEFFKSIHDDSIFELLLDREKTEPDYKLQLSQAQFEAITATFESKNQSFLGKFHPAKQGIPVIDPATARIASAAEFISTDMQSAYMRERLLATPEIQDPRTAQLRQEFGL